MSRSETRRETPADATISRVPSVESPSTTTCSARTVCPLTPSRPSLPGSLAQADLRAAGGYQKAALSTSTAASLTSREISEVIDLLTACSTTEQTDFVLSKPREALRQSQADYVHHWDPRMSSSGNRVAKRLGLLLDCLAKMNSWLRYTGRGELQAMDREPLTGGFIKLAQETTLVQEATTDFLKELKLP